MPTHIRSATRADLPLILTFIRDLAEYEREPQAVQATEALLDQHLFGPGFGRGPVAECLIAELDGTPQGFAVFFHNFSTWKARPGLYLEDLFVRPAARGRGVGKALLQHLARLAVSRGCARFEWAVLDWNTPAIDFYKAAGAVPLDEWMVFRLTGEALQTLASSPT
jgi:GNAT superfamily N-acetyltransferase